MSRAFRIVLILTLLAVWTPVSAQNPANKYKDVYKKYVSATCPITKDSIYHFVYFSRDREAILDHPFLLNSVFKGAQIMYSWRELEPLKGQYDFSHLKEDLMYLEGHGKRLFVQLQDVTFNIKYKAVPNYLLSDEFDGGVAMQYNDEGTPEGWVAKRWNKEVRERFALLLQALGVEFDGKLEGINLQETAIGVDKERDRSFSELSYVAGLKNNMLALKKAFPLSTTMIYANFIPGEWLPWDDKGYLRGIYEYGEEIGVGLGAPDLMVTRKGQLNHPLTLMHEGTYSVPIGIAIQDGNYIGKTGADLDYNENADKGTTTQKNLVPLLHEFAKNFLKVSYMFWVNQEPYFEKNVMPCFSNN